MSELNYEKKELAYKLHKEATVIDFNCDTLKEIVERPRIRASLSERRKMGARSTAGHFDLPRLMEGDVDC